MTKIIKFPQSKVTNTIQVPQDTLAALHKLAREQGITLTVALQKAIATEKFIKDELKRGCNIIVEKPNRTYHQVIFR